MASRHHSLNMSELGDVIDLVKAFEEQNGCLLTFSFSLMGTPKGPDICLDARAWANDVEKQGRSVLASANVTCSALNLKTWNAAVTHVLYLLDSKLAWEEMRDGEPKAG